MITDALTDYRHMCIDRHYFMLFSTSENTRIQLQNTQKNRGNRARNEEVFGFF